VFLDGNDLGCAGAEQILLPLVAKAEAELQERKQAEEAKLAAEAALKAAEGISPYITVYNVFTIK